MAKYIKTYVTGHGIDFEINKRNVEAFRQCTKKWQEINLKLNCSGNSVVLFCGAKNNGKSSLVRHVLNKYVNRRRQSRDSDDLIDDIDQEQVSVKEARYAYYVDFDPGQAELTTPGLVSAHIIKSSDKNLQTPTYLNLERYEAVVMSSVGGTNMSVNPRMYIENCRFVLAKVREHQSLQKEKGPIFINTMGFIRNVGLAMLIDLIKICKPTNLVVLNIESDPMRTVYADLSPKAISNVPASFYYETVKSQDELLNYECDLHNLKFTFVDSSSTATKNRTSHQIAYLAQIPEALYKPIMQLEAKWLSFEKISIYCVSSYPLKVNIVLELLYHSWIHLIKLRRPNVATSKSVVQRGNEQQVEYDTICNIIDDVGENQLYGCGIVVDIDLASRKMAIVTPLEDEILQTLVDCVVKPLSIQVPREIIQGPQ